MTDEGTGSERRASQRYGCAGEAEIVVPGRGLRYQGSIGNLSAAGCFIEAECRLERGTLVEVWMNAEGQPLRLAANLMTRRPNGVGLRFYGVTSRKLEQIHSLIAELAEVARTGPEGGADCGCGAFEEGREQATPELAVGASGGRNGTDLRCAWICRIWRSVWPPGR